MELKIHSVPAIMTANSQHKEVIHAMKKSKDKYITCSNVKDVTIPPNFILKLLERIDARIGGDL